MTTAYDIAHCSFRYTNKTDSAPRVLDDLSFRIQAGERWAIVGPSGCGKSTLLHLLAGLIEPDAGRITYRDEPLEKANRDIQIILQDYGLFPWKTVAQNLRLPLQLMNVEKGERRVRVAEMLSQLSLSEYADRYPYELSGGQRQRVAIGRAMIPEPSVLLMDEPFSAIDAMTRERLQDMLSALVEGNRLTAVMVTHQMEEAVRLSTHILLIPALGRPPRQIPIPTSVSGDRKAGALFCERLRRELKEESDAL